MTEPSIRVWRPPGLDQVEWHRGWRVTRTVPRHWHDEFHIVLIEGGDGEIFWRGAWRPTPRGSLFLMPAGEVHANRSRGREGCTYRSLNIPAEALREVALPAGVFHTASLVSLVARKHQGLEESATLLERETLLLEILVALARRCAGRLPGDAAPHRERRAVSRVRDFLAAHYLENISLRQLASLADLSPYHLNRVFAAETGLPPHAFQAQHRVVRARALLRQGCPSADVAAETGFADQSHLTRVFKRVVGLTPGAYRRGCPLPAL